MIFHITRLQSDDPKYQYVINLLFLVFVGEKFTIRETADQIFVIPALAKRGEVFTAEDQSGQILGTVTFVQPQSTFRQIATEFEAEIHLLAVNPSVRGLGIGATLVRACIERAKGLGYSNIVLSTQPSMEAAHRLYEVCGFKRNSSRDWNTDSGKSYWVFEKSLGKLKMDLKIKC